MLAVRLLLRFSSKTHIVEFQNLRNTTALLAPCMQQAAPSVRQISCSGCRFQEEEEEGQEKKQKGTRNPRMEGRKGYVPRQVDVQTSMRYMESEAYRDVYKDEPVWKPYRRNQKGQHVIPPRKTCIRSGVISSGSACPICRDDYLVLDYRNIKLLRQFISDITGEPLSYRMTGLCQKQIKRLELELAKARDYGYIEKYIPFRHYNYQYYSNLVEKKHKGSESDVKQSSNSSSTDTVAESNTESVSSGALHSAVKSESREALKTSSGTQTEAGSNSMAQTISQPS